MRRGQKIRNILSEHGVSKNGILVTGYLPQQKAYHAFFICMNQQTDELTIFDGALFGKVSSGDGKKVEEVFGQMEGINLYQLTESKKKNQTIIAQNIEQDKAPKMRKRDKKKEK